jgi:hypothetical protein
VEGKTTRSILNGPRSWLPRRDSRPRLIGTDGLGARFEALVADGYHVIGPAVHDGAIVLRERVFASFNAAALALVAARRRD